MSGWAIALRGRLAKAQGGSCFYCSGVMAETGDGADRVTLEHLVTREFGGRTDEKNCVAACNGCNTARGCARWLPPDRFRRARQLLLHCGVWPACTRPEKDVVLTLERLGWRALGKQRRWRARWKTRMRFSRRVDRVADEVVSERAA